jgi:hypothetical protein
MATRLAFPAELNVPPLQCGPRERGGKKLVGMAVLNYNGAAQSNMPVYTAQG